MRGQVIISVTLVRVVHQDANPYAPPERIPVHTLYFAGKDRQAAERAWLRSQEYRDHGMLDWDMLDWDINERELIT